MHSDRTLDTSLLISLLLHIIIAFFLSLITIPPLSPSTPKTKLIEVGVVEFDFYDLREGGGEVKIQPLAEHEEDFLVRKFLPKGKPLLQVRRRGIQVKDEFGRLFERVDRGEMGREGFSPQKFQIRMIHPERIEPRFLPPLSPIYETGRGGEKLGEGGGIGVDIKITGPASKRKILHREEFILPEWIEKQGLSMEGRLKFWVFPDGSIGRVGIERTFGSLRDHQKLYSWLLSVFRKWRFSPLIGEDKKEWGIITIKIKLD